MSIKDLTTDDFDTYLSESSLPVLVDFWADWCQPCKLMLPVLQQADQTLANTVNFAKVDVDANPELAEDITSIPTMRLYRRGEVVAQWIGVMPRMKLVSEIQKYL